MSSKSCLYVRVSTRANGWVDRDETQLRVVRTRVVDADGNAHRIKHAQGARRRQRCAGERLLDRREHVLCADCFATRRQVHYALDAVARHERREPVRFDAGDVRVAKHLFVAEEPQRKQLCRVA